MCRRVELDLVRYRTPRRSGCPKRLRFLVETNQLPYTRFCLVTKIIEFWNIISNLSPWLFTICVFLKYFRNYASHFGIYANRKREIRFIVVPRREKRNGKMKFRMLCLIIYCKRIDALLLLKYTRFTFLISLAIFQFKLSLLSYLLLTCDEFNFG